jgi:hypothetical protein
MHWLLPVVLVIYGHLFWAFFFAIVFIAAD